MKSKGLKKDDFKVDVESRPWLIDEYTEEWSKNIERKSAACKHS